MTRAADAYSISRIFVGLLGQLLRAGREAKGCGHDAFVRRCTSAVRESALAIERVAGILLMLLFVLTAALCFRAIRWDRWANYETNYRPWWRDFPGESHASYKAWYAWRKSWERASVAATISGAGLMVAGGFVALARLRGKALSRWLVVAIVLHGLVVGYFVFRWGPDFRHPYPTWTM